MSLKPRIVRLEQRTGVAEPCWCDCPLRMIEVWNGDPEPTDRPVSRDSADRTVCSECGLPHRPGRITFIEVRLQRRQDDEPAP
jgi:hypothetical protein